MQTKNYDGHGGFVKQSNQMPKVARKPGAAPDAKSWVGQPSVKSKPHRTAHGRKATRGGSDGGGPTSPLAPIIRKPR